MGEGFTLPENWQQIAVVVGVGLLLWLRSQGANPTLDSILAVLRQILAWPEKDPLAKLGEPSAEGEAVRLAVFSRLKKIAAKAEASAEMVKVLDQVRVKIEGKL